MEVYTEQQTVRAKRQQPRECTRNPPKAKAKAKAQAIEAIIIDTEKDQQMVALRLNGRRHKQHRKT